MTDKLQQSNSRPQPSQRALERDQYDYLVELFETFRSRLRSYVRKCVSDRCAVDDIVQDTWERVLKSEWFRERAAPYYKQGCRVDPADPEDHELIWKAIKGQAYFARLSHFKQDKIELGGELQKAKHVPFDVWNENGGDKAADLPPDELEMLGVAIDRLRAHGFTQLETEVFVLYTLKGWKYRAIAEAVGVGKSTIDRIIHKIEAFAAKIQDGSDD